MKKSVKKQNINLNKDDEKLFAFLGAFFTIVGFLIVLILRKKNDYAMFYAKQGLVLFIAAMIFSIFSGIPFIGWIFSTILLVIWLILWIMTFINSLSGKKINTFIIGELAEKIKL
ncbi:hypothetical protein J4218_05120 [Candidatus Pacearchaeota archaeon]|nr:hypothetical protein [uncultured archaeon]MBS3079479.1 hypothetical protein [Candidatus Pacearchaeota archaeon]